MESFYCYNHQGKAAAFIDALAPKYRLIPRIQDHKGVAFVLTDHAVLSRVSKLEKMRRDGISKFFIYPHSARPSLVSAFYDEWPYTTAQFVATPGHIEVMNRLGYKGRVHPVGWSLCEIKEFKPREETSNVLFAPIHPRNSKIDQQLNQAVLDKLYPLAAAGEISLTVRYLSPFEGNGIKKYDNHVTYVEGTAAPSIEQIDKSDIVIGHQTFAFLAVARGVPTLMMGEEIAPHIEFHNGTYLHARGWNDYKDLVMYPIDILHKNDTLKLMQSTVADDSEIREWRSRMIGDPFNPDKFVSLLEGYL